jgi:RNA polymerase sigma factor (sigma-70 family)
MVAVSFTTLSGFRALYEQEYGFVWSAVRRFGVPSPQLEDAVQDTFIVAYRRRRNFTPGPARPWLYGIARGVASNYRRTARRVARKREAIAFATCAPSTSDAHASLQALDRFLANLSPEDRELFVLSEIEGLTGPELSTALQVKTRTIYRRLERLRGRFADEAIDAGEVKRRRPRASAASWAALAPALEVSRLGWLSMSALPKLVASAGLAGAVSIGWAATRSPEPKASPAREASVAASTPAPAIMAEAPPRPTSPTPADLPVPALAPAPAPTAPAATRRIATPRPSPPVDALIRENALLQRAKSAASKGDFHASLAATRLHATEFPNSALSDLRTALRIEALCGSGKTRQARGEAHAFVTQHPEAPLVERIRRACVTKTGAAGQSTE